MVSSFIVLRQSNELQHAPRVSVMYRGIDYMEVNMAFFW